MSNLESTRTGWAFRGVGVFFMLLAIGLTVWDLMGRDGWWPVNLITFACGGVNIWLGNRQIRMAREHHQFMEDHRAEMARLQNRWLS